MGCIERQYLGEVENIYSTLWKIYSEYYVANFMHSSLFISKTATKTSKVREKQTYVHIQRSKTSIDITACVLRICLVYLVIPINLGTNTCCRIVKSFVEDMIKTV